MYVHSVQISVHLCVCAFVCVCVCVCCGCVCVCIHVLIGHLCQDARTLVLICLFRRRPPWSDATLREFT